jgi:hypothetical protein
MIRHIVLFKLKPDVDAQTLTRLLQSMERLKDEIDVIRALEIGQNFNRSPRAADVSLIVDVDDEHALAIFANHPSHQPLKALSAEVASEIRLVEYVIEDRS